MRNSRKKSNTKELVKLSHGGRRIRRSLKRRSVKRRSVRRRSVRRERKRKNLNTKVRLQKIFQIGRGVDETLCSPFKIPIYQIQELKQKKPEWADHPFIGQDPENIVYNSIIKAIMKETKKTVNQVRDYCSFGSEEYNEYKNNYYVIIRDYYENQNASEIFDK